MTEALYKASNVSVELNGTTVVRAQDFQITSRRGLTDVYQLGTVASLGQEDDPWSYNARLVWNPIDVSIERILGGVVGDLPVTWADIFATASLTLKIPTAGLTGVQCTALEYNINVPNGTFQATADFRATGYTRQQNNSITPPLATGLTSFKSKHVLMELGAKTNILRVRSLRSRMQFRVEDWYELGNTDPFYVERDQPQVSVTIEWYESLDDTVTPGAALYDYRPAPDPSSTIDLEVQVGTADTWDQTGNLEYNYPGLAIEGDIKQVRIGSPAIYRGDYRGRDTTTYGFTADDPTYT